jgi:hypothetical protein
VDPCPLPQAPSPNPLREKRNGWQIGASSPALPGPALVAQAFQPVLSQIKACGYISFISIATDTAKRLLDSNACIPPEKRKACQTVPANSPLL